MKDPGDLVRYTKPERQLIGILREGPVSLFDDRLDIVGLKTDRLENEGIVMRCGMTPTDAMHIKGDFDEFDVEAARLGARCVLKSYRGEVVSESDEAVTAFADEVYDLARFRLYNQVMRAFAQDRYWPDGAFDLDAQMEAIARKEWEDRDADESAHFSMKPRSEAALVGVGAPTHVFLGEVARAMGAPYAVPEHARVANAVGAAVSRITVEQQVRINPLYGADGVVKAFSMRGADMAKNFRDLDKAIEAAREQATKQAIEEARRRGAVGDLKCELEEEKSIYRAIGAIDALREYVVIARIG